MPRGQKSKLRAREKRQRARIETQDLQGAEASAAKVEGSPSSSSVLGNTPQSYPVDGIFHESNEAPATTTPAAAVSCEESNEGAGILYTRPSISQAESSDENLSRDVLPLMVSTFVQFLIHKYKTKEPIMKTEMLQVFDKNYEDQFPEILTRAAERMELDFGLELKEDSPNSNSYHFVSKLNIAKGRSLTGGSGMPKTGLVMVILAMIFMKGNRASEDSIWKFLNVLGIYAGKRHAVFGEPRKFITKDLVMERFLVYRKVPKSDPPCNEFLWGPRAYAETTKMKVLQVLAKINNTVPSSFSALYEEALRDEEERAQARAVNESLLAEMTSLPLVGGEELGVLVVIHILQKEEFLTGYKLSLTRVSMPAAQKSMSYACENNAWPQVTVGPVNSMNSCGVHKPMLKAAW
ncbi:PREDICTED: melanoma-associated antigen B1-like [Chrysochloris asiatica]|uniref:Melanoma-associated antigen B1-like n=1 Tax=Chrysochloris asiatica TaxID=185453 RepID=A0A9B0T412_CHRAS|nr:PREDICTED: melanoma-associated antigen B1-like [Chrysochloris asiatica]